MDGRVLMLCVAVLVGSCHTQPVVPEGQALAPPPAPVRRDAGSDAPGTFTATPAPRPPDAEPEPDPDPPPPPVGAPNADAGASPSIDAPRPPVDARPPAPPVRMDAPAVPAQPPRPGPWWRPYVGASWDWQLMSPVDPSYEVEIYDIDLWDNSAAVIADLHARGRKVICYVNLGAWENWREDAGRFPREIVGAAYDGFPDENWLDIRAINVLLPIIRSRLDMAVAKGCDAVEPDNMNGYDLSTHEPTGFPLTYQDQIVYNRLVAAEAHRRGLGVGLKNDLHQVRDLVGDFDFAVNEQCFEFEECEQLLPFIEAGKPVFQTEYNLPLEAFCPLAKEYRFSSIKKTNDLNSIRERCP